MAFNSTFMNSLNHHQSTMVEADDAIGDIIKSFFIFNYLQGQCYGHLFK